MKKIKVMVVDDEQWIVQLVIQLIHWDELGMELIGQCHDGMSAFNEIVRLRPDIVISDIKMPVLDGLGVIAKIKELELDTSFVLLSGYADFEYAQTALKYGVLDYLLKPVNEGQLNNVLLEIKDRFETVRRKKEEEENLREKVSISQSLFEKEFFSELLQHPSMSLKELECKYYISMTEDKVRAYCFRLDFNDYEKADLEKDRLVTHNIVKILRNKAQEQPLSYLIADMTDLEIFGIVNGSEKQLEFIHRELQNWFVEIKNYVYAFKQYEVTLSISEIYPKEQTAKAVQRAGACIQERLICGCGRILKEKQLSSINYQYMSVCASLLREYENMLMNAIQSFQVALAYQTIDHIYGVLEKEKSITSECYYYMSREIMNLCLNAYAIQGNTDKIDFERKMRLCITISDLNLLLKKELRKQMTCAENEKSELSQLPVRRATDYVKEHYMEKLTLEEVAEYVGLNPTYFSKLFKKESQKTFVNYLTEIRIERAKELLCSTNHTMNSIAESVGYTDSRYFSQCFEKVMGMKPSLYRKLYSK